MNSKNKQELCRCGQTFPPGTPLDPENMTGKPLILGKRSNKTGHIELRIQARITFAMYNRYFLREQSSKFLCYSCTAWFIQISLVNY